MSDQISLATGADMLALVQLLYPLPRSITGDGLRQTLAAVSEHIPLEVHEVPSGTPVLDWIVPPEWTVREAYVADSSGRRVIDFDESNLHLVGYSVPVSRRMTLAELRPHLHTLPEHPSWIPYRTSYYSPDWGFCLAHATLAGLPDGEYEVLIDSTLVAGHLTYGEHVISGRTSEEVLVSCHVCHPSLANDNLAGIAVAIALAQRLPRRPRYTYRFLFGPGTIGAITWLSRNAGRIDRVKHGLVLACAGDRGRLTYKCSRRGDAEIDRVMSHVLRRSGREHTVRQFTPDGYDERQFCSPGFNLGVGCLTRTSWGAYPEYHTSADNPDFVCAESMTDTVQALLEACIVLDRNQCYVNLKPYGEPQLGTRGLYGALGGRDQADSAQVAVMWVLSLSDGKHSLLDIADRAGLAFESIAAAADILVRAELIEAG